MQEFMVRIQNRLMEEDGINTIEVVLILVVLVALVLIFKNQILGIVDLVFAEINKSINKIY
ncbi:MAG: hypothetical protein IJL98_03645 [Lachnospiraceae bacterium]|nr:hypothetical protein [Lachnospiraceae bacterium]